ARRRKAASWRNRDKVIWPSRLKEETLMAYLTKASAVFSAGLVALGAMVGPVAAQEYPSRDIEMIIPFGVGGGSDTLARTIASVIGEMGLLPVQILPENRPGGSGAVGYGYVGQQQGND